MLSYVLRRLLLAIPTLIGMTAVVFFIMALSPGNPAGIMAHDAQLKPQEREALRRYYEERYGLNKPVIVQYANWLGKISPFHMGHGTLGWPWFKKPDLGESFIRNRKVSDLIAEYLPVTLLLDLMSLPIIYSLSVIIGMQAARHRGTLVDVGSGTVLLGLWSFPVILAGLLVQGYLANKDIFYFFPPAQLHDMQADSMAFLPHWSAVGWERGWLLDTLWHLVLPIFCLSYGQFAFVSKLSRGAVLENINADYVRTARAKGVSERSVLYRHVLRNSLIPMITFAAQLLPALIGGSIVVETIFSVPGMGKLGVDSIFYKDSEVVLGIALISGVLGLGANLAADLLYAVADPRVAYE
jgi:ABC-type dipeptide/oligopeptide/nickel transport system permease component